MCSIRTPIYSLRTLIFATLLASAGISSAQAAPLDISLASGPKNPATPTMGDQMRFRSVIANLGERPVEGLVAWISLVEVDPGREQPVDLEDWSAHKAVTGARLAPGARLETEWPMRLIQDGDYRVVISATDRGGQAVYTSPVVQFHVTRKPVVESRRILPVALGVPLVIAGVMGWRRWGRSDARRPS